MRFTANRALHRTAIPPRSIAADELAQKQRGQVLHSRIQPNPAIEWDGAKVTCPRFGDRQ